MTRIEARAKAMQMFGEQGYIDWRPRAPDEAARSRLREDLVKAQAELAACAPGDKAGVIKCRRRISELHLLRREARVNVGVLSDVDGVSCFQIKGQGDTAEQAFERAERAMKVGA